jgi:hypothetical protein
MSTALGNSRSSAFLLVRTWHHSSVGELVRDHIKDVTIAAAVGNRADKEDKEKVYATVKVISIQ